MSVLGLLPKTKAQYARAEPLYRRALAIFQASLGLEHPNTQTVAKNYDLLLAEMQK